MHIVTTILIGIVAIEHIGFLILEMFLFAKPVGQKIFRSTPQFANEARVLAANQGLYNGFLAAGLLYALATQGTVTGETFAGFFLSCVVIAGIFGAATVSSRILWLQAAPALAALAALLFLN